MVGARAGCEDGAIAGEGESGDEFRPNGECLEDGAWGRGEGGGGTGSMYIPPAPPPVSLAGAGYIGYIGVPASPSKF